jgi:hypothetical protein
MSNTHRISHCLAVAASPKQRHSLRQNIHDAFVLIPHGISKLAWLQGMQVQVDHPLIRQELLPIAPLESYPFYENLRFDV